MKSAAKARKLLKELSRDPHLKRVIAKARRHSTEKRASPLEQLADMYVLLSSIASSFSKKKARALDEQRDIVQFLVQVGLLLKENILDRPEVQEFLSRSAKRIRDVTRERLGVSTPQAKRPAARRSRASRQGHARSD
jgi:hypothetical protein